MTSPIVKLSRLVFALVVAAGLSACSAAQVGEPTAVSPSTTPSIPQWRGPLQMPDAGQVLLTIDDIAIVSDNSGVQLWGVDLSSVSVLWTIDSGWTVPVMGDATGLVVTTDTDVTVYDPRTGDVIGQAPLTPRATEPVESPTFTPSGSFTPTANPPFTAPTAPQTPPPTWESLYWAGNGYLVMGNASDNTVCARAMSDPGKCLWKARNMWTPSADFVGLSSYVIAGEWVITAEGIRDLATGEPASFGSDVGLTPAGPVYYIGTSPDRVFRMTSLAQVMGVGPGTATPWDVTSDKAISAAVSADVVDTDPASPVYVAIVNQADTANTVTAYSWASGQQLWQRDNLFAWSTQIGLDGGVYLGTTGLGFDRSLLMLNAATGDQLQQAACGTGLDASNAAGGGLVFIATDRLNVYDNATGRLQWSTELPDEPESGSLFTTTHYLAFMSPSMDIWVMDI